jgi:hypothetical protein
LRFGYAARNDSPPGKQSFAFFVTDVAGGDGTSMPQCKACLPLNMAQSRKHHNTAEFNADTDGRNGPAPHAFKRQGTSTEAAKDPGPSCNGGSEALNKQSCRVVVHQQKRSDHET